MEWVSLPVKWALAAVMSLGQRWSKPCVADWRSAVLLGDAMAGDHSKERVRLSGRLGLFDVDVEER